MTIRKSIQKGCAAMFGIAALGMANSASAVTVGVDPGAMTNGYMNVFDLPSDGGGFIFGSPWGFSDLSASHGASSLTLGAAPIDTSDGFWYVSGTGGPGQAGNKQMHANSFTEAADGVLTGTLDFSFEVLSNTFNSGYQVEAFINDFNSDFSYVEDTVISVTGPGVYNLSQLIDQDGVTQYGFRVIGANVWITDVAAQGNIEIAHGVPSPVPVPAAVWLFASGLMGMAGVARRKA